MSARVPLLERTSCRSGKNRRLAKISNLFITRPMTRRKFLATSVAGIVMAGCAPDTSPRLRIGTTLKPGCEPLYIARHLEALDEKHFLLAEYPTPSEMMIAFQNRALDV